MEQQSTLLHPYKSLGQFADSNRGYIYNAGKKLYYAITTNHSYKVFSLPDMKVKLSGPHFESKLSGISGFNEYLFVIQKNRVCKMSYYHILCEYKSQSRVLSFIVLGNYVILANNDNQLLIFEHNSGILISQLQLTFNSVQLLHPPTYLNKVLACGEKDIEIWNISTGKMIYSLVNSLTLILVNNAVITCVECSPILDIIAIAISTGKIVLHNIKQDQQLFAFNQNSKIFSLSFSKVDFPLLAVGDEQGHISIWNLNEKKQFSYLKNAHKGPVTDLNFLPNQQTLISASGEENAIYQWQYEESEPNKFVLFRQRKGLGQSIKKLRFMGEDGLHILASSNNQDAELRDFSLLNECISSNFSLKEQSKRQMQQSHIWTEQNTASVVGEIQEFAFSTNRERDWANVLTIHKNNEKPCLWSSENHTIVKKNVELFEEEKQKELLEGHILTAAFVTFCGNFGVLGLDDGRIIKVNMQSGLHQKTFQQKSKSGASNSSSIIDLFVDQYNKYLLSADSAGYLVIRDFYSGDVWFEYVSPDKHKIVFLRGGRFSQQFLMALSDYSLEVWDVVNQKRGRRLLGHTQRILDACFSFNNQHVISCALDNTIKIWDLLTNSMICNIETEKPVVTLDVSPDGELLASSFANSREINLWHNLVLLRPSSSQVAVKVRFQSKIQLTERDERKRFYMHDSIKKEAVDEEQKRLLLPENKKMKELLREADKSNRELIRFTELEAGKWVPLIYLEEIKERSKISITEEQQINIPFFLDLDNKDEMKKKVEDDYKQQIAEKSKIIKNKREQYLEELGSDLEKIFTDFSQFSAAEMIQYFKTLTASQLDYEMRKFVFGNNQNIERMLMAFCQLFDDVTEFDLKNTYFNRFLKVAGDDLIRNENVVEKLFEVKQKIQQKWSAMQEKIEYITCLAEHFAKVPNQ